MISYLVKATIAAPEFVASTKSLVYRPHHISSQSNDLLNQHERKTKPKTPDTKYQRRRFHLTLTAPVLPEEENFLAPSQRNRYHFLAIRLHTHGAYIPVIAMYTQKYFSVLSFIIVTPVPRACRAHKGKCHSLIPIAEAWRHISNLLWESLRHFIQLEHSGQA